MRAEAPLPAEAGAAAPPHVAAAPLTAPAPGLPRFSREGASRGYGALKDIVSRVSCEDNGGVALHGGLPPPEAFPIVRLTATLADGTAVEVPAALAQQQYNVDATGLPALRAWAEAHVAALHAPPRAARHRTLVTDGASHALELLTSLLMERGDTLLVEEYTYSHFLECVVAPKGLVAVPVAIDAEGLVPAALAAALAAPRASGRPRLLYTVPVGQNPTGVTATPARKRAVYELCRAAGVIIIEDDPYCYLQWPRGGGDDVPGLAGLRLESYLSIDTAGIVVRLDSFAKFLAPGLRLGWATAAPALAERLAMALQAHTLGGNMVSQALVAAMLGAWGAPGLEAHVARMQRVYAARAAALGAAAAEELAGLAEWAPPAAGMFLWLRLVGVRDATELAPALRAAGVSLVPGRVLSPRAGDPAFFCPYVRVSFSHAPPEALREGMRRLARVLRAHAAAGGGEGGAAAP